MIVPRATPEGTIPLIAVEGSAYDCGREYAEIVMRRYPGYRRYLDAVAEWESLTPELKRLFEDRAPHVPDVFRGILDVAGPPEATPTEPTATGCTSFGVSGSLTLDGQPISGQTKDTAPASAELYIVLRLRIEDAPTILVLAYPGEVLGYGMWSTGMSVFRNSLHSSAGAEEGLTMVQWGLLALAADSVREAGELAKERGIAGTGNVLLSDRHGESLSVEFNAGGVSIVPARNGIATHANHPEGEKTAPFEHYPDDIERENSRYRASTVRELLEADRGRLTTQKAMMCLADHSRYPRGICRHTPEGLCTTAAVVVEPTKGKLHVTRGPACSNWPMTYTV